MVKLKIAAIALGTLFLYACPKPAPNNNNTNSTPPTPQNQASQGWTAEDQRAFYHTSQGTRLIPYKWFLALEEKGVKGISEPAKPFLTDATVEKYNLIPDHDTANNPDQLPVGFVKDVSADGEFISIGCATCHTGQIKFNGKPMRIEGGPSMNNLNGFFQEMFEALARTKLNPAKFDRFARQVLGENSSLNDKLKLKLEIDKALLDAFAMILQGKVKNLYPTEEGFGRLDALGRGGNLVLGKEIGDKKNLAVADAPVSFPHLWGTPSFDWVQWNGSIQQPMARNIGEALGVNTPVTLKADKNGDMTQIFNSAVKIENLHLLEGKLEKLLPPKWPEQLAGTIDRDKAAKGQTLYAEHCAACHESQPNPPNEFGKVFLHINMYDLDKIGTDPTDAVNFNGRSLNTGDLSKPPINLPPVMSADKALEAVATQVAKRKYDELNIPQDKRDEMDGFRKNIIRAPLGYRARNMDGIWATAPYLHNNSVPNLYQLLLPASERATSFYVGNLEYDTKNVGFKTDRSDGAFELKTSLKGNSNAGHEFRDGQGKGVVGRRLTDEERWAIVEYLKTR